MNGIMNKSILLAPAAVKGFVSNSLTGKQLSQ
jgi:hypothetical protein